MHDAMFRHLEAIEEEGRGDDQATHDCGSA